MKISVLQYATSLYELVIDKSELEVRAILKNFVSLLSRQHDLHKSSEIIKTLMLIWDKQSGEVAAELTSAQPLQANSRQLIIDYLKNKSGAKTIVLEEKEDKNLLGGFVLKYDSRILDGSLRSSLESLKSRLKV